MVMYVDRRVNIGSVTVSALVRINGCQELVSRTYFDSSEEQAMDEFVNEMAGKKRVGQERS